MTELASLTTQSRILTDWISPICTLLTVGVTAYAAWHAKRAADEAAKQVELQRPRPILRAAFLVQVSEEKRLRKVRSDDSIVFQNIGNSPAFEIRTSALTIPNRTASLETAEIDFLPSGESVKGTHSYAEGSPLFQKAELFAMDFAAAIKEQVRTDSESLLLKRYEGGRLELFYKALDGRQLVQHYVLIYEPFHQHVRLELVGSVLDA